MIHPAIKLLLGAWLLLWLPLHLLAYPPSTFLWLCAYGNVLIVAGVCCESRLLVSWQAVALLVPHALYIADAVRHGRATAYLFDPSTPFAVRSLSFFHFVMPFVLLFAVARLGYDRRALPLQLATAVVVFAMSPVSGSINIWISPVARQHVAAALILAPLILHVPAHLALRSAFAVRDACVQNHPNLAALSLSSSSKFSRPRSVGYNPSAFQPRRCSSDG